MSKTLVKLPVARVAEVILVVRDEKVILDSDLAPLYGVETRALIQAVKRNNRRFPLDFMFQLTRKEFDALRSQFVISKGSGGRRHLPYAFTEHGAVMAANVLNSERAVVMSVYVVRAFVELREVLIGNSDLSQKLDELERKLTARQNVHEKAILQLFAQMRNLLGPQPTQTSPTRKEIGFRPKPVKR